MFDVRGNDGGSDIFGINLLNAIWGDDFTKRLPGRNANAIDYRASQGNLALWKQRRPEWAKELGEDHDLVRFADNRIAGIEQALKRGDTFYHIPVVSVSKENAIRPGEVTPKIYLLSDGACKSACLGFADRVLSIPNAELIGAETNADTQYIENRAAHLPSEKAYLWFSMKVWRDRLRGTNQPRNGTVNTGILKPWKIGF